MKRYEITYTDHVDADSAREAMRRVWSDLDEDLFKRFAQVTEVAEEEEEATDVRPK